MLVAPILWPSGLAPSLPIFFCLLGLFSSLMGWRPVFLSVCACCAYSLSFWAGALCSYAFVLVAPILWPSGLAPCVPIRSCLLRLFSGPLGWHPVFLSVCACCAYSLALGAGALSSYLCGLCSVFFGPLGWPLFFSLFYSLLVLRLIGPMGGRPLFLSVRACCAYSLARCASAVPLVLYWICAFLALWAGALSSYPFMLVSPVLWLSGLAFVLHRFCVSLTLRAGGLSSYPFMLAAPILSPSWLMPHFPP